MGRSRIPSNSNSIGERIKILRQKRKLTQKELGQLVGCAQNTIASWEKNQKRLPGKKLLSQVAHVLEVSIDYLLGLGEINRPKIPCYGEVLTEDFDWPNIKNIDHYIEVPEGEYNSKRYSFKILDELLEPMLEKSDYGIFEDLYPEDGDIVILVNINTNKAMIKRWRENRNIVMISEINPYVIRFPYFFEIESKKKNILRDENLKLELKGKLVAIKQAIKIKQLSSKISYIFS